VEARGKQNMNHVSYKLQGMLQESCRIRTASRTLQNVNSCNFYIRINKSILFSDPRWMRNVYAIIIITMLLSGSEVAGTETWIASVLSACMKR
jgi:hypothetical protein